MEDWNRIRERAVLVIWFVSELLTYITFITEYVCTVYVSLNYLYLKVKRSTPGVSFTWKTADIFFLSGLST